MAKDIWRHATILVFGLHIYVLLPFVSIVPYAKKNYCVVYHRIFNLCWVELYISPNRIVVSAKILYFGRNKT